MGDLTDQPGHALRFKRGDARVLRALMDRVAQSDMPGDMNTFRQAALSAELGEPLVIVGATREEAEQFAARFARLGTSRPRIDELTGNSR